MHSCDKEQGKVTWGDQEKPLTCDRCDRVYECADFSSQRSCTAGRDDAQSTFTMQGKPIRNRLSFIFTKYVRGAHHDRRAEAKNNRSLRIQHRFTATWFPEDVHSGFQNPRHSQWKEEWERRKGGKRGGFPGGSAVKNLPGNAGDTALIPGLGGPHMPRSI